MKTTPSYQKYRRNVLTTSYLLALLIIQISPKGGGKWEYFEIFRGSKPQVRGKEGAVSVRAKSKKVIIYS
jgi:hypothetical protein